MLKGCGQKIKSNFERTCRIQIPARPSRPKISARSPQNSCLFSCFCMNWSVTGINLRLGQVFSWIWVGHMVLNQYISLEWSWDCLCCLLLIYCYFIVNLLLIYCMGLANVSRARQGACRGLSLLRHLLPFQVFLSIWNKTKPETWSACSVSRTSLPYL